MKEVCEVVISIEEAMDLCQIPKGSYNTSFSEELLELSNLSFEDHVYRFKNISEYISDLGEYEFSKHKEEIASRIANLDPSMFSLSLTGDPSIHYIASFDNSIKLFLEICLDDEELQSLYEIYKDGVVVKSGNSTVQEALSKIEETLILERGGSDSFIIPSCTA